MRRISAITTKKPRYGINAIPNAISCKFKNYAMKNLFVLLLAAFSALSPIFAQAPQFKSGDNYTVFGLGIGMPVGQFGATKSLDTDGFAQPGIAINLDDSYFFTENFAILFSGYITFNYLRCRPRSLPLDCPMSP